MNRNKSPTNVLYAQRLPLPRTCATFQVSVLPDAGFCRPIGARNEELGNCSLERKLNPYLCMLGGGGASSSLPYLGLHIHVVFRAVNRSGKLLYFISAICLSRLYDFFRIGKKSAPNGVSREQIATLPQLVRRPRWRRRRGYKIGYFRLISNQTRGTLGY